MALVRRWAPVVIAMTLLAPGAAFADPSAADRETARSLMDQGDRAYEAKDYPAALKAYQSAHSLVHLPSTGIWLAKTQVALGQLVEARETALEVTRIPKKPAEHPAIVKGRAEAADLADKLAARIPSIEIAVEGQAADTTVTVTLDGVELAPAALGVARKVNPGKHKVVASAPGYDEARAEVDVSEGASTKVPLKLSKATAKGAAPAPGGATTVKADELVKSGGRPLLIWGGFGAAVAGTGVGVVAGILSLNKKDDVASRCDNNKRCPQSVAGDIDASKSLAWVSNIGFGVGIAGIAVGVFGLITSTSDEKPKSAVRVVPVDGGAGVEVKF